MGQDWQAARYPQGLFFLKPFQKSFQFSWCQAEKFLNNLGKFWRVDNSLYRSHEGMTWPGIIFPDNRHSTGRLEYFKAINPHPLCQGIYFLNADRLCFAIDDVGDVG